MERAVHRRGERPGVLGAEQVRPTDRSDEQRPTGQQQERLVRACRVGDRVADVLGRVPGRVEGREPDGPDIEGVAVARRAVWMAELGAGPDDVGRAGQRRELASAGHVVVVEVGLEHVADAQVRGAGRVKVDIDVAARIDDGGHAGVLVRDERAEVAESFDPVLGEAHRASLHRTWLPHLVCHRVSWRVAGTLWRDGSNERCRHGPRGSTGGPRRDRLLPPS